MEIFVVKSGFTRRGSLLASVVLLVIAADARGQAAPLGQLQLPTDPAAWINADPISLQVLAGKGVGLWFYEEGCPAEPGQVARVVGGRQEISRQAGGIHRGQFR